MKKSSNLVKIEKEKLYQLYCPISYFFSCFVELVRQSRFYLAKAFTNGWAIGKAESRSREDIVGFFK